MPLSASAENFTLRTAISCPSIPKNEKVDKAQTTAWNAKSLLQLKDQVFGNDKRYSPSMDQKGNAIFEGRPSKGFFIRPHANRTLLKQMEESQGISDDHGFLQWNVPVFALVESRRFHGMNLYKNPSLMQFGFQNRVDPYTAHQNIAMYLSGVLGTGEKETITVDDKSLLYTKGFDHKSFKKEPTKRKHRNH